MKWFAILFGSFILAVIVLADMGELGFLYPLYDFPYGDKVGHFLLYGLFSLLIDLALFRSLPSRSRNLLAVKVGLALALAITVEEFSQQYFSNRTFDPVDLVFSFLGVAFFSWLAVKIKRRTR